MVVPADAVIDQDEHLVPGTLLPTLGIDGFRLHPAEEPLWIGNGVLDSSLEDESLLGEFLRTPVSEGGVERWSLNHHT